MISSVNSNQRIDYRQMTCPYCSVSEKSVKINEKDSTQPKDSVTISAQARELQGENKDNEKVEIEKLKKRDREVKAHEMAHIAAGTGVVKGGAHFEYQVGPDGGRYAVGGHVNVDTSAENRPEATIRKMQVIKNAALAPAQPSGTDRAIAVKASAIAAKAKTQLAKERAEEAREEQDDESLEDQNTVSENSYNTYVTGTMSKLSFNFS